MLFGKDLGVRLLEHVRLNERIRYSGLSLEHFEFTIGLTNMFLGYKFLFVSRFSNIFSIL